MAKTTSGPAGGGQSTKPRRLSAAEWAKEVSAWKKSGQTSADYARARGLHPGTLLWWSSRGPRLAAAKGTGRVASAVTDRSASAVAGAAAATFLPVRVGPPARRSAVTSPAARLDLEVVLGSGRVVRFGGVAMEDLSRVLEAIEGGASC